MSLLADRVAVVTGGAQGIGYAIAAAFLHAGARVVVGDLNPGAVTSGLQTVATMPGAVRAVRCDVTDAADITRLIDTARAEFGSLDIMVNNAGITRDASMRKMTEVDFDRVIGVHLKGTWNGTRAAAEIMRENPGGGSIINISSLSGKVGMAGQTNYSAAKAGIIGLTKAAAKETARHGVRVNAIAPGLIRSPMTTAMPQQVWDSKLAEIPMSRAGEPEEVAQVALFLASAMSSYMTGTTLEVTGGRFM
ncbi:3-oxoacyl-ACP reductase FabG [Nocardia sp. NPDC057668]|uniref:3-oxoacyl-ACP reductase FabG n=1 Tax=Nocardia sp. NPDC057668 TaxID=3346202 RepID=UPI003671AB25